jgi:ribosomal-protein-serine acetyltransferase
MHTLHIDNLLLRPFVNEDAAAFAQATRESVTTVGLWMPWCHANYTEQDALDWFTSCRQGLESGSAYEFGVFTENGSELLGGAGLNMISKLHAYCNLGYWVRQNSQGLGIAPKCVQALKDFAFNTLNLHRLEIVVAVGNQRSANVARKSGATLECVAKNRLVVENIPVAASIFSITP